MKLDFIKTHGGVLIPANDMTADKMQKFKTGEPYEVDIKLSRNPAFHRKVFAFFAFCFEHWSSDKTHWDNMSAAKQSESFRKELIKLAGFTDVAYSIDGQSFTVEAKSLSFANMAQDEFEECYNALINAAIKHVFGNTRDEKILNRLQGFF